MKARFDKKEAVKKEIEDLNGSEKEIFNAAKSGSVDVAKCVELVEKAKAMGIELNEQG